MSPLVILMCASLAASAIVTLASFRYAITWQKRQWALTKNRTQHFDEYWEAKNLTQRWDRVYRWSLGILIALLLISAGIGAFSVAF